MSPRPDPEKRRFRATKTFWRNFHALPESKKASAKEAFRTFRNDPFNPALRTHKIESRSARKGQTVYSVRIEADLRAVFILRDNEVITLDIGTHAIYR